MPLLVGLADNIGGGMGEVLTCGVSAFGLEMTGTWMSVDNTSSLQIKDTRKISGHTVKQVVFPSTFSRICSFKKDNQCSRIYFLGL